MTQPILMTLASATEHPMIDIDSTAFIQFGIFVVMAFAASKFLFKPYLAMREERDAGIDGARKDAANLSAEADAKLADYEEKLANARTRAQEERRKIRAEAAEHQQSVADKSRTLAQEAMEAASQKVASETKAARAQLLPKADALASDMVSKLLGRKAA